MNISEWQTLVHETAKSKGWYEGVEPGAVNLIPEKLCLIHSEVSEALESFRDRDMVERVSESGKPEGLPTELADVVIRVMDLCGHLGIDLQGAMERKHAYNETRAHRHGGKVV